MSAAPNGPTRLRARLFLRSGEGNDFSRGRYNHAGARCYRGVSSRARCDIDDRFDKEDNAKGGEAADDPSGGEGQVEERISHSAGDAIPAQRRGK